MPDGLVLWFCTKLLSQQPPEKPCWIWPLTCSLFDPRKKKKKNYFDHDDFKLVEDFETFSADKDFQEMMKNEPEPDDPGEAMGQAWGGKTYSINKGLNDFM